MSPRSNSRSTASCSAHGDQPRRRITVRGGLQPQYREGVRVHRPDEGLPGGPGLDPGALRVVLGREQSLGDLLPDRGGRSARLGEHEHRLWIFAGNDPGHRGIDQQRRLPGPRAPEDLPGVPAAAGRCTVRPVRGPPTRCAATASIRVALRAVRWAPSASCVRPFRSYRESHQTGPTDVASGIVDDMRGLHTYLFGTPGAPEVLALHGLTGHGRRWEALGTGQLGDTRIIAPDLRGHGRSPWTPPWGLDTHVGDLVGVLDEHATGPSSWWPTRTVARSRCISRRRYRIGSAGSSCSIPPSGSTRRT